MKVEISNTLLGCLLSMMVIVGLNSCGNSNHSNEGSSTSTDDTTEDQAGIAMQNDSYQMLITNLDSAVEQAGSDQMNITIDEKSEVQRAESELYSMTLDGASSIQRYSM